MSESKPRSKKKSKAAKSNQPGKSRNLLVGGIIAGIGLIAVVVLLLFAIPEFQTKQAATSTSEAWRNALRSKATDSDLTKSEFSKIPVKGNPSVTSEKAAPNSAAIVAVDTYTWKGRFRSYAVRVSYGLGNDPPVELIEGP